MLSERQQEILMMENRSLQIQNEILKRKSDVIVIEEITDKRSGDAIPLGNKDESITVQQLMITESEKENPLLDFKRDQLLKKKKQQVQTARGITMLKPNDDRLSDEYRSEMKKMMECERKHHNEMKPKKK